MSEIDLTDEELEKGNFAILRRFMITDLKLSGSELVIYAVIYGFTIGKNHCYTGGIEFLKKWTGIEKRNVFKNLDSLVSKRMLIKEDFYKNNVRFVKYTAIIPNKVATKSTPSTSSVVSQTSPGVMSQTSPKSIFTKGNISPRETYSYPTSVSKEINVTKEDTHRSLSPSYCENAVTDCSPQQAEEAKDFDIFWIAYPKHCGKTEARKAFHKHVRHEDMKELLDGVDKYKRTKQWSESKYIPYPSTFLNQERWKDGVEPDYKNWDEMSEAERGLMEEVLKGVDPNDLR